MATQFYSCLFLAFLLITSHAQEEGKSFRQALENYSFDYLEGKTPLSYTTYGTSIELFSRMKLVPPVPDRSGAIMLSEPLRSSKFEILIDFSFQSEGKESDGFGIYLLKGAAPEMNTEDIGGVMGYRDDFNGMGIFIKKHDKQKKWVTRFLFILADCSLLEQ